MTQTQTVSANDRPQSPPLSWQRALVLFWSIELWLVQEMTLDPTMWDSWVTPTINRTIRFVLNLILATGFVRLGSPLVLRAVFLLNFLFYGAVVFYHDYFERALSLHVLLTNFEEGMKVSSAATQLLRPWHFVLVASLLAKMWMLGKQSPAAGPAATQSARRAAKVFLVYAAALVAVNFARKPMNQMAKWETVSGIGYLYGYLPAWAGEMVYVDEEKVLERALERAQIVSNELTPHEGNFPTRDRIFMVQVESLDSSVIDFSINGREVTPVLNAMAKRSMYYKIRAPKQTGSCDSDFTALMSRLPSCEMPNYNIDGYPYDTALPHLLQDRGYYTRAVHGVSGLFFNRRDAYSMMGFNELFFKEEFVERTSYLNTEWTIRDLDLFDHLAQTIPAPGTKHFTLAITATSHMPFRHVPKEARTFFPTSNSPEELYFDSMNYLDQSVGELVSALPPESTLILYGDHLSKITNAELGYDMEFYDGIGLVPFLVYDSSEDLSVFQKTRDSEIATSGRLQLLDMMTWVRTQVLREETASGIAGPAPTQNATQPN